MSNFCIYTGVCALDYGRVVGDWFGDGWLDRYWPFLSYIMDETIDAFENKLEGWLLNFKVGDFWFFGSVDVPILNRWWVQIHNGERIVRIEDGAVRVGYFDENGDVVWVKTVV